MIRARELQLSYPGDPFTLGPVSGEFGGPSLVVAGLAQSGKTTLLKALCGLLPATAGSVEVDGVSLTGVTSAQLGEVRSHFGMVFQSDALFDSMSALENVALPLRRRGVPKKEVLERSREALLQVGLDGHENALPERLSGGMRKRLGLARAIVARPTYLLADDPLAGLDPGTSEKVVALLFELWRGRGGLVIAVADPAPFWAHAAEALILDEGKVVARGPAKAVHDDHRVRELFVDDDEEAA